MKIMPCPLNGPRNIQEFICAGPVEPHPDPNRCTDHEWTEFVWMEENLAGVVREWWCHVATSYWFIAERNTVSDEILATYPADRVFSERVEFEPLAPPPETGAKPEPPKEPAPPPPKPPLAEVAPAEAASSEATPEPSEAAPAEVVQDAPAEEPAKPEPEAQSEPADAVPEMPEAAEETPPADAAAEGDAPADEAAEDDAPADDAPPREPKDPAP